MPDQNPNGRLLPVRSTRAERAPRELVTVRARADIYRSRLDESRERFRDALELFSERTTALNPITYVRLHPYRWVLSGFTIGLVVGYLTAARSGD